MSAMRDVLYPPRSLITAGECGHQPIKDLETWVKGGVFHEYGGRPSWEPREGETYDDAHDRLKHNPARLKVEGKLDHTGHLNYWIWCNRAGGDADEQGGGGPHMTPEDAAYSVLTLIEEYEREQYEESLVVGLA